VVIVQKPFLLSWKVFSHFLGSLLYLFI